MSADGIVRERLPNGLRVVVASQPHLHRAVASLFLRVGAHSSGGASSSPGAVAVSFVKVVSTLISFWAATRRRRT